MLRIYVGFELDSQICEFAIVYMPCSRLKDVKGVNFRWISKPVAGPTIVQQFRNAGGDTAQPIYIYMCLFVYLFIYLFSYLFIYLFVYFYTDMHTHTHIL